MSARIVVLGSADAFSSAGRGNTAFLVEDGAPPCTVDFGPTALLALKRLGRDPAEIAAVHLTHLHGDHVGGIPMLFVDAAFRAHRTAPLEITGPPGTAERVQTLWKAFYADAAKDDFAFELRIRELRPGETVRICDRDVSAFRAQHHRGDRIALMLSLRGPAGTLAFTGDTGPCDALRDLARGASLLCAECTDLEVQGTATRRHLAWAELRDLLPALGVRRVILGHIGEAVRARAAAIEEEASRMGIDLRVADDLSEVALDPGHLRTAPL
ncbi:MAG: MBL fold metallo-hydrolase [Myxococcales bacterium]